MDLRTGLPFWPIKNGLLASYPSLDRDERAEFAIVGSGISGALAAYELSRAGADVVVLDRHDVGMGSSAATTGLLTYETDASLAELSRTFGEEKAARVFTLGIEAIVGIEGHCLTLGDDCGFSRRASLYLASAERDAEQLTHEWRIRRQHDFVVDLLSRQEIRDRYGIDAPAALYSQGCAEIDCYRFVHRLLAAVQTSGGRIYDRTDVTTIAADRQGIVLRTANGHQVRARRLVCATGYEAARFVGGAARDLLSTWAFISEPIKDLSVWPDRCLIWETARPYLYLRTTGDGRVLVGGEDEPWSRSHENEKLLVTKTDTLRERAQAWFPKLRLDIAYRWAGVFSTTTDGLPLIGEERRHPHVWFTLGLGGNGITFSAIAAAMLRDEFLGRPHPDAHLFSFDRRTVKSAPRRWLDGLRGMRAGR